MPMTDNLSTLLTYSQEDLLEKLQSTEKGLTSSEAKARLKEFGVNELKKISRHSVIIESLRHSINPLNVILLIAASISGLTGNSSEMLIITFIVALSIAIDYIQSHRALVAVKSLQSRVAAKSTVLRDNELFEIFSKELVPGDIIELDAGDLIPADAILLKTKGLHVYQAALTGESLPIEKEVVFNSLDNKNPLFAKNILFSGSSVVSGSALALVVATGINTEYGKISKSLSTPPSSTEFENGIIRFSLFISKTIFFLVLFVFIVCIFFQRNLLESLLFAIALAVGLTPEFLPMITTVTLASGAIKMARQKVIVKNLASIQNFGSIDVLCSDKTGTLTTGKMQLREYVDVNGTTSEKTLLYAYLTSLLQTGVKNSLNEAVLHHINVNPLDLAILQHEHPNVQSYRKIDEIPFDFERRRSSIVIKRDSEQLIITKGAPESILKICHHYELNGKILPLDQSTLSQGEKFYQTNSAQGFRILAVAYQHIDEQSSYDVKDEKNMILLGYLLFADPPLQEAAEIISQLKNSGVNVKVLTGDNELVALNICKQVGIDCPKAILGDELESMSDETLTIKAQETLLFARVSPSQKQRIISVLRRRGHVVGYIGDGINDAPSLHIADVGISVADAVDVAKETADIILLEKNLKVLHQGILEGRKSFGNIMKYLMMGTSSNFGNMFSMAGAILFLPFLPMLPLQILLNNLLYDISQLTIPTDRVDESFIKKPRHWDISIIKRFMLYIGPISSIFDFLTFFVMIKLFSASESMFQTGWFIESLVTQTLVIFIIRTSLNPFKSRPSIPLCMSVLFVVTLGIFLPFSSFAKLLGFVALPLGFFVFLIIAIILYLFLVQMVKQKLMFKWLK
ncbi:MAG: magnesium-translocating P-type ATPase [Gammaproteobacteria bacterium 39-13]|nr:magnesium-translocating P-type ATPase [Gammaproteobacteria bacterium]OJV93052.1 MAG: magnesium-translocating P-type ATPase [Gammaproteobacteria bacterium 39-13]